MNRLQRLLYRLRHCCAGPPGQLTSVTATAGGGSGEVQVTWDPLPASDHVAFYRVYVQKGIGTAWHLAVVTDDALGLLETGRLGLVDAPDYWPWPTIGVATPRCYYVTAVSREGLEGPRSAVECGPTP